MSTLRQQYDVQSQRAQQNANFYGKTLTLVMVKHKGYATRISVLGNAISHAMADIWRADGSNVRTIKTITPNV